MKIKIVQLIVGKDILSNKEKIIKELRNAEKDEWIVFPEAILSGYYPHETTYTKQLNWKLISGSLKEIEKAVRENKCHCILGSATKVKGSWRNRIWVFSHTKDKVKHDKIQLSKLDKQHFQPGKKLQVFKNDKIKFGLQACRELIFPNQWSKLKKEEAQIIFHLNNAIQPQDALWKHILITRAVENSIYVVSVNNADSPQELASFIISPQGEIIAETGTQVEQVINSELNLNQVIDNLKDRQDY